MSFSDKIKANLVYLVLNALFSFLILVLNNISKINIISYFNLSYITQKLIKFKRIRLYLRNRLSTREQF